MVTPKVWLMTAFCTGSIVLKFGKSPTGDVVSTGNDRNGFIITEGPVAPISPGKAPPTALHPPPAVVLDGALRLGLRPGVGVSNAGWEVSPVARGRDLV